MSNPENLTPEQQMKRLSRRSFVWAGMAVLGSYGFINWLASQPMGKDANGDPVRPNPDPGKGIPPHLRSAMDFTDGAMASLFASYRLEPEHPEKDITRPPRVNANIGAPTNSDGDTILPAKFTLTVSGLGPTALIFTLEQLRAMPCKTQITEFRCVEGWAQVCKWRGVPLQELAKPYLSKMKSLPKYVRIETENGEYFVGLDVESALHPQTLLAYDLNDAPLEPDHGAPIRLAIPVKYGIKNIKWLTKITFTDEKPIDYWGERGYTWFGGL